MEHTYARERDGAGGSCFGSVNFSLGRLFDTTDIEEARNVCGRVFSPHSLAVIGAGQALSARMDHLRIGPMSLNRLSWGARVRVDPGQLGTFCLLSLPVRGSAAFNVGGEQVVVSPRQACLIGAHQRFHFEADEQFDQVVLRFEYEALARAWRALSGAPPSSEIRLNAALPLAGKAWRALEPMLQVAAACASTSYAPAVLPHIQLRLQDMLLTAMLLYATPNFDPLVTTHGPSCSRELVRRAQSWFLEHLSEPVTLTMVALAIGVSSRTLQAAFQSECGSGPMQWLREQRLAAVHHHLLRTTRARPSISDAAFANGFSHLGEFSRAYRRRFGETPRETLSRR
jgi:AraC-like DNA-binding protein